MQLLPPVQGESLTKIFAMPLHLFRKNTYGYSESMR